METRYPACKMIIGNQELDIATSISISEDLGEINSTASFTIPYFETEQWTTKNFKKYDAVRIYFNFYDNENARRNANISEMSKIFDGYIDTLPIKENKSGGIRFDNCELKSTLGLAFDRSTTTPYFSTDVYTLLEKALQETELKNLIDGIFIDPNIPNSFILKISSNQFFGKVLEEIKEKYALQIFQRSDSVLVVRLPSSFNTSQTVYEYDLLNNVFDIDYGDITQRVDSVVVLGLNCVGVAFDPIAYRLKNGIENEDFTPDKNKLAPLYIIRRDVQNIETAQRIAREKLVELAKNYAITLSVVYSPEQFVGDAFNILNSQIIPPTQIWFIKSREVSISKDGGVTCSIVGYSNSVSDFPKDILLSSTGILDTDILELTDREINEVVLH